MASMQATDKLSQKRDAMRRINESLNELVFQFDRLSTQTDNGDILLRQTLDKFGSRLVMVQASANHLSRIYLP
jgi:hypothetical protein